MGVADCLPGFCEMAIFEMSQISYQMLIMFEIIRAGEKMNCFMPNLTLIIKIATSQSEAFFFILQPFKVLLAFLRQDLEIQDQKPMIRLLASQQHHWLKPLFRPTMERPLTTNLDFSAVQNNSLSITYLLKVMSPSTMEMQLLNTCATN